MALIISLITGAEAIIITLSCLNHYLDTPGIFSRLSL